MEDFIPIFAIFAVFGTITAIIVGPTYFKSRERREMQETVRAAIEKGQPLPPEIIEALGRESAKANPSRTRDIRRGVIWLAVGIGLAAFSLLRDLEWSGDNWEVGIGSGALPLSVIPLTIGVTFIILSFFNKTRD